MYFFIVVVYTIDVNKSKGENQMTYKTAMRRIEKLGNSISFKNTCEAMRKNERLINIILEIINTFNAQEKTDGYIEYSFSDYDEYLFINDMQIKIKEIF